MIMKNYSFTPLWHDCCFNNPIEERSQFEVMMSCWQKTEDSWRNYANNIYNSKKSEITGEVKIDETVKVLRGNSDCLNKCSLRQREWINCHPTSTQYN